MLDIHSHILPKMDDGSGSTSESLELLSALASQGIHAVAATSHFYPGEEAPEQFLRRRADSMERLSQSWTPGLPRVLLGAEVYYFEGISQTEALEALCYQGTRLLLLEMPFSAWTDRMAEEILDIPRRRDITVLLAHIERYMRWQRPSLWDELLASGTLMQCNAEFFCHWRTRRRAVRMLEQGRIHFIGSDCHNMAKRPPRIGEALDAVGDKGRRILAENIRRWFPGLEV